MPEDTFLVGYDRRPPESIRTEIYAQDPLHAKRNPYGIVEVKLPGEYWLGAGPISSRVCVEDFDWTKNVLHAPARVLKDGTGFSIGRRDPVENFKFHQVNVWATVTRVLNQLGSSEFYGRRIPWAFDGGRLTIFPHAMEEENAYYDRDSGSLCFGYFTGNKGAPVYTCVSHDIVVHELGHAVLDGLKPVYLKLDSPAVAGFHEYYGDALAMTSALTMDEVIVPTVFSAPRRLRGRTLVSDIAREFGSSWIGSTESCLRTANNNVKMSALTGCMQEHDHSLVLSGAYYDVLKEIYAIEFERRLQRRGSRRPPQLAVAALKKAAQVTGRMMLRGLDYCPPAGLSYLKYARAVIRADEVAYPIDSLGYRGVLTRVFCAREIATVASELSDSERLRNHSLRPYDVDLLSCSHTDAYEFIDQNREVLRVPRAAELNIVGIQRTRKEGDKGYFPPNEIIVEFTWGEWVNLRGKRFGELKNTRYRLWCGGTIVFDTNSNVLHYVCADASVARRRTLLDYLAYNVEHGWIDMETMDEESKYAAVVRDGIVELHSRSAARHKGQGGDIKSQASKFRP